MRSYTARVLAAIAFFSLLANVLLFYRYSSSRPLVTVGGAVITKKQFSDQLEHEAGQAVLTKLVFSTLVVQAAARNGVTPTEQDIDDRIEAIRRQSPQVLPADSSDPQKMAQFRQDLAVDMALENLRIQNVALSPTQIADYYDRHQADFARLPQAVTTTVVTQNVVDAQTAAVLLRENDPPEVISRQPGLRVAGIDGYSPNLQGLPPPLNQQIARDLGEARIGTVKTYRAADYFVTFRVDSSQQAGIPPLNQVRGDVERAARLEIAPSAQEELMRLYHAAKPTFSADKYAGYFAAPLQ